MPTLKLDISKLDANNLDMQTTIIIMDRIKDWIRGDPNDNRLSGQLKISIAPDVTLNIQLSDVEIQTLKTKLDTLKNSIILKAQNIQTS